MIKKSRHVVRNLTGGWSVLQTGASRASRVFGRQVDAIRYARGIARQERTDLYVHRSDGTIKQVDSYGAGPYSSRR